MKNKINNLLIIAIYVFLFSCIVSTKNIFAQKKWPEYRLRGVVAHAIMNNFDYNNKDSAAVLNEKFFKLFKSWNINVIRVLIRLDPKYLNSSIKKIIPSYKDTSFVRYYKNNLNILSNVLRLAEKYNIYIIITTNHNLRGGESDVFYDSTNKKGYYYEILNIWKYIAKRFGKYRNLIAYDPLAEPNPKWEQKIWREKLFNDFCEEIRSIDSYTYIFYAPGPYGLVDGYKTLIPFNLNRIIYSLHFYYPHGYTMQGILKYVKNMKGKISYPGFAKDAYNKPSKFWDKERLSNILMPFIKFGKKYDKKLFIGEFAVVRWAPNASIWLNDVISLFEENNLNWTYLAFGSWNGFNPTFNSNAKISSQAIGNSNNNRLKTLKYFFNKNK